MEENEKEPVALHVLVVGFHHKKGMQVEYCYPPLYQNDSGSCELPDHWRHLPSLCLPDGAHNHEADTIFFHLPHLTDPDRTVFGVSCYRQIDAEKVTNKTADITRNSVQKSVCVLCTLPIYGYIQERLQVTTRVYFKGADFADVRDLAGLYQDLNTANWRDKLHHGVSGTECVQVFGRNLLVLFKLVLLERSVLLYHSPVAPVGRTIASLLSLLPHMLPHGVMAAAAQSNFAEPKQELPDKTSVTKTDFDSLHSSTDSALEKSVTAELNNCDVPDRRTEGDHHVSNGGPAALQLPRTDGTEGNTGGSHDTNKSTDSNHSEDSAVGASAAVDSSGNALRSWDNAGLEAKDSSVQQGPCHKNSDTFSGIGEDTASQDGSPSPEVFPAIVLPSDGSPQPSMSLGRLSSLREALLHQSPSVDSSCAVASSTRATTGADTPNTTLQDSISDLRSSNSSLTSVTSRASFMSPLTQDHPDDSAPLSSRLSSLKGRLSGAFSYWTGRERGREAVSPPTPASSPAVEGDQYPLTPGSGAPLVFPELQQRVEQPTETGTPAAGVPLLMPSPPEDLAALDPGDCGLPLQLFTEGYLVHPYLSLQQLDVIGSPCTRAFLAGASNTLFLHKRPLYDVLVQVSEGKVEILDPELRRQLSLSTEDLRFADNIVRQVEAVMSSTGGTAGSLSFASGGNSSMSSPSSPSVPSTLDVWVEGVGWAGGEEWLRHQFRVYLITLLRASLLPEHSRECAMFNPWYMCALRATRHWGRWEAAGPYPALMNISAAHPNVGHLSMTDVRIRLAHSLLGGDRSRRINQTLATTGTAVVKTREAVGGALTSARGALSSLWSTITTTTIHPQQDSDEFGIEDTEGRPEDGEDEGDRRREEELQQQQRQSQIHRQDTNGSFTATTLQTNH